MEFYFQRLSVLWVAAFCCTCASATDPASTRTDGSAQHDTSDGSASDGESARDSQVQDGSPSDASTQDVASTSLHVVFDNLTNGEALPHPLVRIAGTVDTQSNAIAVAANDAPFVSWRVQQGSFKALAHLRPGANTITLQADGKTHRLDLTHVPRTNPRRVRFVYVKAADGSGTFQAPPAEPSDEASAVARLSLAADMLQMYMSESLLRQHGTRRTFRVARDANGKPDVLLHTSKLTRDNVASLSDVDLWSTLYAELTSLPHAQDTIFVAIMAFTRFDPNTKELVGHTALGGGQLALFGSSSLHTWPEALADVPARLADTTTIDGSMLFDDSAGRQRAWANYATGLGATLHELGHCLGAYHPQASSELIMSRGFDHLLRWFSVREPESATGAGLTSIASQDEPRWHGGNAAWLLFQRYLEDNEREYTSDTPPSFNANASEVVVFSNNGLGAVLFVVDGEVRDYRHYNAQPPEQATFDLQTLRTTYEANKALQILAIDTQGNSRASDSIALE